MSKEPAHERSVLNGFGMDLGAILGSKIDQKSFQNRYMKGEGEGLVPRSDFLHTSRIKSHPGRVRPVFARNGKSDLELLSIMQSVNQSSKPAINSVIHQSISKAINQAMTMR